MVSNQCPPCGSIKQISTCQPACQPAWLNAGWGRAPAERRRVAVVANTVPPGRRHLIQELPQQLRDQLAQSDPDAPPPRLRPRFGPSQLRQATGHPDPVPCVVAGRVGRAQIGHARPRNSAPDRGACRAVLLLLRVRLAPPLQGRRSACSCFWPRPGWTRPRAASPPPAAAPPQAPPQAQPQALAERRRGRALAERRRGRTLAERRRRRRRRLWPL